MRVELERKLDPSASLLDFQFVCLSLSQFWSKGEAEGLSFRLYFAVNPNRLIVDWEE